MEEKLISLKTAKLAKEKGFDIECTFFFNAGSGWKLQEDNILRQCSDEAIIECPTQSLLQKWIRDIHEIDITVSLVGNGYGFYIHNKRQYTNKGESYGISGNTYEEALEQGLFQALNLIN